MAPWLLGSARLWIGFGSDRFRLGSVQLRRGSARFQSASAPFGFGSVSARLGVASVWIGPASASARLGFGSDRFQLGFGSDRYWAIADRATGRSNLLPELVLALGWLALGVGTTIKHNSFIQVGLVLTKHLINNNVFDGGGARQSFGR